MLLQDRSLPSPHDIFDQLFFVEGLICSSNKDPFADWQAASPNGVATPKLLLAVPGVPCRGRKITSPGVVVELDSYLRCLLSPAVLIRFTDISVSFIAYTGNVHS